ncbi:HAD family hydrolase [Candidatus Woesearchaeota archaeon]|nr:HAD family hydrolase [Candidatus Woesearchaeota archaeon]
MIKLFDWDGTIVNSDEFYYTFLKRICQAHNKNCPFNTQEERRQFLQQNQFMRAYLLAGFKETDFPMIYDEFRKYSKETSVPLINGMLPVLLTHGRAIVSHCDAQAIMFQLEKQGVNGRIKVYGQENKEQGLIACIQENNMSQFAYVTDFAGDARIVHRVSSVLGIEAITIGVSWGSDTDEALYEAGAEYVAATPQGLELHLRTIT